MRFQHRLTAYILMLVGFLFPSIVTLTKVADASNSIAPGSNDPDDFDAEGKGATCIGGG